MSIDTSRMAGIREAQVANTAPRIKKAAQVAISCRLAVMSGVFEPDEEIVFYLEFRSSLKIRAMVKTS
ncbi:hypothetical protein [Gracilimonas sp.]|uniref:hypothetical protein n=1 Tax=Gracilimonas TaxID=649462 RepID=UPI0025C15E1A|nr:hypothetical protein [Gracilimonas sp.]